MHFSVIMPVYNVSEYVEDALESILKAVLLYSPADVELIVVDDESTDETIFILNEYEERYDWIKLLKQNHQGLGAARNFGLSQAKGDYILFVDGDDCVSPDIFLKLSKTLEDKRADLVVFKWRPFGEGAADSNDYGEFTVQGAWIACWNKCYRRELIADEKFPEGVVYEDTGFFISAWYRAKSKVFINETLYFYRHRNDGLSKRLQQFETRLNCLVGFKDALTVSNYAEPVKMIVVETNIKHINRSLYSGQTITCQHKNEIQDFFEDHDLFDVSVFESNNRIFRKWLHWSISSRNVDHLINLIRCKVWLEKMVEGRV